MNDPFEITVGTKNSGAVTVSHHAYVVSSKNRYIALKRIADFYPDIYGIVFCRTREETKEVAEKLMADGYNADALHGDLSQAQRDYVMKKFRNKNLNMLVATDVAARGLDVHDLTHVINYSIPDDLETYTHRSGRTGRAGKEGISILIANLREKGKLKRIEQIIKKKIEIKKVPGGQEICAVQLKGLIQKVLSTEVNRILEYYENAQDINLDVEKENERRRTLSERNHERNERRRRERDRDRGERSYDSRDERSRERRDRGGDRRDRRGRADSGTEYTRFFMNIGKREQLDQGKLLKLLNEHANDRDIHYGSIDIMRSFSFFEVESKYTDKVLRSLANATYDGLPVSVQVAQSTGPAMSEGGDSRRDGRRDFRRREDFRGGKDFGRSRRDRERRFDRDRGNHKGRRK